MTNEELVRDYHKGDKEAMSTIIENNRGLVNYFVNQFYALSDISYLDRDDLEQNGYIGLMDAVKGYDPVAGVKFSTYASVAIKRCISRGLRISSPWEMRSDNESKLCQVVSAFKIIPGTENETYMDVIEDLNAQNAYHKAIERLDLEILRNDLFEMLESVFFENEKEKHAIILKYGLNGHDYTLKEIGELYGVTTERARQWVSKGFRRIRKSTTGTLLKDKYLIEYGLSPFREKLSKVEYEDPAFYTTILDELQNMLGE